MVTTARNSRVYFLSEAVWKVFLADMGIVPHGCWDIETPRTPLPPDPWAKVWQW